MNERRNVLFLPLALALPGLLALGLFAHALVTRKRYEPVYLTMGLALIATALLVFRR